MELPGASASPNTCRSWLADDSMLYIQLHCEHTAQQHVAPSSKDSMAPAEAKHKLCLTSLAVFRELRRCTVPIARCLELLLLLLSCWRFRSLVYMVVWPWSQYHGHPLGDNLVLVIAFT
ncbi:hypothetical protein ABBQ38_000387 [Trebouxia sp. C0009 RCD-2024]